MKIQPNINFRELEKKRNFLFQSCSCWFQGDLGIFWHLLLLIFLRSCSTGYLINQKQLILITCLCFSKGAFRSKIRVFFSKAISSSSIVSYTTFFINAYFCCFTIKGPTFPNTKHLKSNFEIYLPNTKIVPVFSIDFQTQTREADFKKQQHYQTTLPFLQD